MESWQVPEAWMPAATGACFLPLFLLSVWMLSQLPKPNTTDVAERSQRQPMNAALRWSFLRQFLLGMTLLCVVYFFLTAYRDYRDNFQREIFDALGYGTIPAAFSMTELPIGFVVMLVMVALNCIRDNRHGLVAVFIVMIAGMVLLGASTLAFDRHWIPGVAWMLLVGLGAYLAYVPFNSLLFDRLLAATRHAGTAVFAIYVADATGYTGAIVLQLYKDFSHASMGRFEFFHNYTYFMSAAGALMLAVAGGYFFMKRSPTADAATQLPVLSSEEIAVELQMVAKAWNVRAHRRMHELSCHTNSAARYTNDTTHPTKEITTVP
jgi:hypothetical protein